MLIRVLDIETSGMEPPAEVVEIGWQDLLRDGSGERHLGERRSHLFDALNGIPPEVVAVHHLTEAMLEAYPPCLPMDLQRAARGDHGGGEIDVLAAHNCAFERLWFTDDLTGGAPWICTMKCAMRAWPHAPKHNNQALRYWLGLDLPEDLAMPPHRAGPDAYVSAHILARLLGEHSVEDLIAWTKEPALLPTCPIGKFRGKPWAEVETGFLNWMLGVADMEADLKWNARRELERRRK